LGLYLALLLNRRLPMKALIRAVVLLPFVTPTVLSAIAFWWIYDPQFSIISWSLIKLGLIGHYIDFLGEPWNARWSVIAANVWRGIPFVAITLLAGLQTISPSLYEAATLDGAASEGMDYLERLPRRVVTLYLPLAVFLFVLLFPFYWMTTTTFKPDDELYDYARFNPFWVLHPTLDHVEKLFFETSYPSWLINTMIISVASTAISLFCSVCAAYAIERLRFSGARYVGLAIFLAYLVPPSILFIPLAAIIFQLGLFDSDWALILTYPTFLIPFCTWLLMGYFRTIPYELEECALIDGATRLQVLWKITLPLAVPGLISAGIFAFTLSWNEFIYALTFISSSENKTVPVGAITELVEGDVYHWGSLMAAALFGSLPVVILYSFFVEYYVSSLTGAVKE
jgi:multiple sugar transport system permease protein